MRTRRAVVLARGLGTRMREPDPAARLSEAQRRAADAGSKMMVPVHGRPCLDYALGALADAGISDVALVVAPDHAETAGHYAAHPPARVSLVFVVQPEALGTANAVLAAEAWTAGAPFLAVNADNLYPVAALRDLASLAEPGLLAFERDNLVRTSNIAADRILAFALVDVDDEGYLTGIVEKPASLPPEGGSHESGAGRKVTLVSMNCWRFDARIFAACRDVARSARGEF
jgi:dTDP-glucose pyrophosphorylase